MTESTAQQKSVIDKITSYFTPKGGGSCRVDAAKYVAAVHVKPCKKEKAGNYCYTTIACAQEITPPEYERQMIEVENAAACDIFEGGGTTWPDYVPDSTNRMGEFSQELYYTPERYDLLCEMFESDEPYIIVIDVADNRRTQLAFKAYLTKFTPTFSGKQDAEATMAEATFQPAGKPFKTEGVLIPTC